MQTILRVVTPRDQVGASVVLLILDLLLLILELFDACLACLCTLSALFLSASSCIGVTCVAVLSLDTSRVAGATPIEHTLPNSRKLLLRILALAWSWSWSTRPRWHSSRQILNSERSVQRRRRGRNCRTCRRRQPRPRTRRRRIGGCMHGPEGF